MVVAIVFALAGILCAGTGGKAAGSALVTSEVVLAKEQDTYLEVRHIVLRGSNREIGRALGNLAKNAYGIKLVRYAAPVYAEAHRLYLKKNYPILLDRAAGVAEAYGVAPADNTCVTSELPYDIAPFSCSGLFVPPACSENGHIIYGHNVDFYIATLREMLGMKAVPGERKMYSRTFVMELYPDEGYSSLVIGSLDLMNGFQSGINSEGLLVAMLADNDSAKSLETNPDGDDSGGLSMLQLNRLVLDTCATIEEAKIVILNNKLAIGFEPGHVLIGDRYGKCFIYEVSAKDLSARFVDGSGKPMIITNHAVHKHPDVDKFPSFDPKATYNSFYRYLVLYKFLQDHPGKLAFDDVRNALVRTYGNTHDADEGAAAPLPLRTLYPMVYDISERTLDVKFYLKDGDLDPGTGKPVLVFSKPFTFTLKEKRNLK
jgi:hypothetical protein